MAQGPFRQVTGGYVKCGDQECSLLKHEGAWELVVEEVIVARSTEWPIVPARPAFGGATLRAKLETARPYLGICVA